MQCQPSFTQPYVWLLRGVPNRTETARIFVPQWIGENDCEITPTFTPLFLDPLLSFRGHRWWCSILLGMLKLHLLYAVPKLLGWKFLHGAICDVTDKSHGEGHPYASSFLTSGPLVQCNVFLLGSHPDGSNTQCSPWVFDQSNWLNVVNLPLMTGRFPWKECHVEDLVLVSLAGSFDMQWQQESAQPW